MMSALVLQFERNAMIPAPPFNKAGLFASNRILFEYYVDDTD